MSEIELCTDPRSYFEDAVHTALERNRVEVTGAAEHYVAGLLCDYARGLAPATTDQPLTFQLRDALTCPTADRFIRLQGIGDGVLYLLGFFGGALMGRGADRRYVMSVGASAYSHAAAMLQLGASARGPDVLRELANKFERLVQVLQAIADSVLAAASGYSDGSALRLYERWCDTGSQQLAAALSQLGMTPSSDGGSLH